MWADLLLVTVGVLVVCLPLCFCINRTAILGVKHPEWPQRICALLTIAAWGTVFLLHLSRWIGAFS